MQVGGDPNENVGGHPTEKGASRPLRPGMGAAGQRPIYWQYTVNTAFTEWSGVLPTLHILSPVLAIDILLVQHSLMGQVYYLH